MFIRGVMKVWHIQKMKQHIAIKSHIFRYCLLTEKKCPYKCKEKATKSNYDQNFKNVYTKI